ncbi:NAD-dependent epimerase/dehydratase [Sulfuricella denitrificans skB26]|uniref:GDP-L-fucose synthase n=1 Tax=Sulfuricella denitrificans (strain DSM 22764 / NBRC 105220 / skB26) TaxID=1163617 RepID=S6AC10_SULDS|nr:GDP-L-fucose synthase [Sulfuricella denitrificans]BAN35178.1 NAD-dependent epimerase/dehydratase [Sulfuricella denitrificans skB26]
MQFSDKIYVAGHRGLVGSALMRRLEKGGYSNIVTRTHAELDLKDQRAVTEFFAQEKPDHVFLAAAKVGGIVANNTYPADFIYQNLMIQSNVIHAAYSNEVKKLLFLGSSCIYPKFAPQPMKEEHLLTGVLEPTNEPYAVAKIAGIKMCGAYNRQYDTNFMSVMPTNLYGLGDNYDLQNSHVMPALIRKMHEAKIRGDAQVSVWGSGTPRREFLYGDDMADACVFLMENRNANDTGEFVNIGVGEDITIRELAERVAKVVGFHGELVFDSSKPDGTPQKLLDVTHLNKLGWRAKTAMDEGIGKAYQDFMRRYGA